MERKNTYNAKSVTILSVISFGFLLFLNKIPLAYANSKFFKIDPAQYPWHKAAESQSIAGIVGEFYTVALGIVGVAALGALIYGGILWTVSGAVSTQQEAKEWISGAIWGLALLLAAALILNTINPALAELKPIEIEKIEWEKIQQEWEAIPTVLPENQYSEEEAYNKFVELGIGINSLDKTSLNGLPKFIPERLAQLEKASGADIVVTGGTESGHITHGAGKPIVDLRENQKLFSYIRSNATFIRTANKGTEYTLENGTKFLHEEDHWHVRFPVNET